MKRLFIVASLLWCLVFAQPAFSGENNILIERGTEVMVRIVERLKSNTAKVGQTIHFVVEREIKNADGRVLIRDGASAYGRVTQAAKAGFFGAKGKLAVTIDYVEAYDGTNVYLSGSQNNEGNQAAIGIFRGTNAVIEAGTIFSAYVANATVLDGHSGKNAAPSKQASPIVQPTPATQAAQTPHPATTQQDTNQQTPDEDKEYDFILVNKFGSSFSSIYLAAHGKPYWHLEQDKVKGGSLKDGESRKILLPTQKSASYISQRKNYYCNLLIKLPSGKELQWLKIDFTDVYKIEITKQNGKPHLTRFVN